MVDQHWLLSWALETAVPTAIHDLYESFQHEEDGIPAWMIAEAVTFGKVLAERGDRLLFKSERKGETAELFTGLARSLSIMAFFPGGVPFKDIRFDALSQLTAHHGEDGKSFCQRALQSYAKAQISRIPVTCWTEGKNAQELGSYDASGWFFDQAEGEDLLRLRANGYRGRSTDGDNASKSLLSYLSQQAQQPTSAHDSDSAEVLDPQLLLRTQADKAQEIVFQVEPAIAGAWLSLYRHHLLTGERWILPSDPPKRGKKNRS